MRRGLVFAILSCLALLAAGERAAAGPPAAVERKIVEAGERRTGSRRSDTSSRGPAFRGTGVPPVLVPTLRARLDSRIARDIRQIRGLRGEAMSLLEHFVADAPPTTREMPEALLRLGELRWETERDAAVERFAAWEKRPVDQRGPAPEPDYGPARELFGRVIQEYPRYADMDLALYVDGSLATEQGRSGEATARFQRIVSGHPRSRFLPDAHMALGEALFSQRSDFSGALAEYEKVLAFPASDLRGLALFKSAWCLWRLGRNDEASARFVRVFEATEGAGTEGRRAPRQELEELQGEALRTLVEVFTEDERNSAGDMHRFLQRIGGDRFAVRIVQTLAATYYDQAHYERGIEAYELLLRLEPTSREAPDWVLAVADGYAALEDHPRLRGTYERLLAGYGPGGPWARTQADPRVVAAASSRVEAQLRGHAVDLHGKAQRDKTSRGEFEAAANLYDVYLTRYESAERAYAVHFYLAEIHFHHLERYADAARHYLAAAKAAPVPTGVATGELATLRHDALYNALAALERVRGAELEARAKGSSEARAKETDTDRRFEAALELYAQLYPKDPALPELFFRQGKLYYDHGIHDAAVKIWGALLERFPQSPEATPAGELLLDSFNRARDYENIEVWARRLKAAPAFQSATNQARLDTLLVQAVFKQGEQRTAVGDHRAAALAYLRAAKEFPKDSRAAQACTNAAAAAKKAGDLALLQEAGQLALGKDYRDHPESPQAAWTAASTLQAMGLFAAAASFHEGIAALATKDFPHFLRYEHTKDAAYNAVVLRLALGEHDKAVEAGNRFIAAYGTTPEADEVVFLMGKAHQDAGRPKEAVDLYRKYVARTRNVDHKVQGYLLLALALQSLPTTSGDTKEGSNAKEIDRCLAQAVALGRQAGPGRRGRGELGPEGRYAAARARYLEGERILARFEAVTIQGDVKQLAARLRQKSELLKQAATVFLDTASLGVAEWTTAALYQVGHTYELFAKALRDAPAPEGLDEAGRQTYTEQIEGFVVPIEERSLDAYENGWKKALELGIYNPWTARMREALGRLNGELYPPFKEIGLEVRAASASPLPPLLEAPRRGGPR